MKKKLSIGLGAIFFVLLILVFALHLLGFQLFNVTDDSMEPELKQHSLVIVQTKPAEHIHTGELMTYYDKESQRIVTHTVVSRDETGETFYVKSHAATTASTTPINRRYVLGQPFLILPRLGTVGVVIDHHLVSLIFFSLLLVLWLFIFYSVQFGTSPNSWEKF